MVTPSISTAVPQVAATPHVLVKTANGEYTADSVAANPSLAAGLIKTKDGNYMEPIVPPSDRFPGLEASLASLKLGG